MIYVETPETFAVEEEDQDKAVEDRSVVLDAERVLRQMLPSRFVHPHHRHYRIDGSRREHVKVV
jgi:hypothetical protein